MPKTIHHQFVWDYEAEAGAVAEAAVQCDGMAVDNVADSSVCACMNMMSRVAVTPGWLWPLSRCISQSDMI